MHNYGSKKKIIKAQWGLQFSSSPLTSLNPAYSANQGPNFNNAFQFGQRQTQTFGLETDIQERWNKLRQDTETQKFNMGLNLSNSSNPNARQYGQQLVQERMDQLNQSLLSDNAQPENTSISGAGFDWSAGLNAAGSIMGKIPGQAGKIGSSLISTAGAIKGGIDTIKEASAAAKAGAEGMGKVKTGGAFAIAGAVADLAGSFLPEKTEYSGDKGGITQTIDTVYDGISDAAMSFGPVGMIVGGAMKGANLLGKGFNALGGGTDGMTTQDAILGSSLFSWNVGLINGFGGKRAETITKDEDVQAKIGSGYTGSFNKIDDALLKSGKKYGLFSSGARKEANEEILEARRQQNIMTDIANNATNRFLIRDSMAAINGNRRRFQMQGGYDQSAVRVGRHGMVIQDLQRARRITSSLRYQKGGKVSDPFQTYLQTLPESQRDDSNFRVRDYWEFNGRPKDFNEAVFKGMFTQFEDGWHANSVAENPTTGEIEFMKSSSHPNHYMEIDWYNSDDGAEFRSQYELQKTEPYWKYVKRKGTDQPQSFKEGGSLIKSDWLIGVNINSIPLEFRGEDLEEVELDSILPEFKEGGSLRKKSRTLEELIAYAKQQNPRFVQRMSEPIRDVDLGNGYRGTHRLSWGTTNNPNEAIVYPEIFENENGELIYDPEHAFNNAKTGDMLIMTPEEAEIFTKGYKQGWPEFFQKFAEGGKFNLIPEGALHARKHNMEVEGITPKGIPVVSHSEGGEIEQQAEIERNEVILRLEITKQLEELQKNYYNDNYTQKQKDEFAIEAGKLLTYELLQNTVDNTGLLNEV